MPQNSHRFAYRYPLGDTSEQSTIEEIYAHSGTSHAVYQALIEGMTRQPMQLKGGFGIFVAPQVGRRCRVVAHTSLKGLGSLQGLRAHRATFMAEVRDIYDVIQLAYCGVLRQHLGT
ncbi:hypothetical protein FRB95_004585 [Tulasnella sp. JGI-2019a]|nr:hypothetical protein FRB95_004585 [Tulasnella sp. JGI-2019a]